MDFDKVAQQLEASLSLRRAWIEMTNWMEWNAVQPRRSPYGERGLKFTLCVCHDFAN